MYFARGGLQAPISLTNPTVVSSQGVTKAGQHPAFGAPKAVWLYGYHPDMRMCGFTPNQAAMVKLMAFGDTRVLLIDIESLTSAMGDEATNLEVLDTLAQKDQAAVEKLQADGVIMQWHQHCRGEVLYVPQGWIVVEKTTPGSNLNYGLRKSFMLKSKEAVNKFKKALSLYRASERPTTRLEAIAELMAPV